MAIDSSLIMLEAPGFVPIDDASLAGGLPDTLGSVRFQLVQPVSATRIQVVSADAGDAKIMTITGRSTLGTIFSETIFLNGTTVVQTLGTFEFINSIYLDDIFYTGPITVTAVTGGGLIATFPTFPRARAQISMFQNAFSDPVSQMIRYEKAFWRNGNSPDTLASCVVQLAVDPDSRVRQGVGLGIHPTTPDSLSVANRLAAPVGITFVDDNVDQNVPGDQNLDPGESVAIWYEQTLAIAAVADTSDFTSRITGAGPA